MAPVKAGIQTVVARHDDDRFHSPSFRPSAARAGIQPALEATTCLSCDDGLDSRFRGNDVEVPDKGNPEFA